MKNKSGILASILCLTMLSGLTFTEPTYTADLDLTFDYHDLNTKIHGSNHGYNVEFLVKILHGQL